ncbi:MAG: 4Fe-4S binding protein [Syntrophobacteraceae bacterium]
MDKDKVYQTLASHLDRLPAGFPKTETGVEIRILKRLFTPEEAALAQLVTLKPETAEEIASRTGRDAEELASRLQIISRKGLVFRLGRGDKIRYMAANFIVGIWEFNVNRLDPELINDVGEYVPHYLGQSHNLKTPQLRTIPISKALPAEQAVMPYEEARRIILEQEKIIVAPCICRKEHKIMGKGCDKRMEACLVFGIGAQYYEENGLGRPILQAEALSILNEAENQGLVLQPSNTQKVVNICMCCGCCCQILKNLKRLPNPARYAASNYFAVSDRELCTGCGTCIERCQMDAIEMNGDTAEIKSGQCIGCGLCVPTCPVGAMSLNLKPEKERSVPPSDRMEAFKRLAENRVAR